jgi:hypothetical protein
MIGTGLMVQHYVAEIARRHRCHLVSLSQVLTPRGWTTVRVSWDLSVTAIDDGTCEYTNSVTSNPTSQFLEFPGLARLAARSGGARDRR